LFITLDPTGFSFYPKNPDRNSCSNDGLSSRRGDDIIDGSLSLSTFLVSWKVKRNLHDEIHIII